MKYKITVLGGDGIGPEVIEQGLKVLNATAKKFNFEIETEEALEIENWMLDPENFEVENDYSVAKNFLLEKTIEAKLKIEDYIKESIS